MDIALEARGAWLPARPRRGRRGRPRAIRPRRSTRRTGAGAARASRVAARTAEQEGSRFWGRGFATATSTRSSARRPSRVRHAPARAAAPRRRGPKGVEVDAVPDRPHGQRQLGGAQVGLHRARAGHEERGVLAAQGVRAHRPALPHVVDGHHEGRPPAPRRRTSVPSRRCAWTTSAPNAARASRRGAIRRLAIEIGAARRDRARPAGAGTTRASGRPGRRAACARRSRGRAAARPSATRSAPPCCRLVTTWATRSARPAWTSRGAKRTTRARLLAQDHVQGGFERRAAGQARHRARAPGTPPGTRSRAEGGARGDLPSRSPPVTASVSAQRCLVRVRRRPGGERSRPGRRGDGPYGWAAEMKRGRAGRATRRRGRAKPVRMRTRAPRRGRESDGVVRRGGPRGRATCGCAARDGSPVARLAEHDRPHGRGHGAVNTRTG